MEPGPLVRTALSCKGACGAGVHVGAGPRCLAERALAPLQFLGMLQGTSQLIPPVAAARMTWLGGSAGAAGRGALVFLCW